MYDPLHDPHPGIGLAYPDSYWASHSGQAPTDHGPLIQDTEAEVVIIGAGYTGLSCAYHLAAEHGIQPLVLEANRTAWGCSGRNAGFVLKSSGRKPYSVMKQQYGEQVMQAIYREFCEGLDTVKGLIATGIQCDQQDMGYLRMAHKPAMIKTLQAQAALMQREFNYQVEFISRDQLHQQYVADQQAYAALRFHDGFGLNPLKLAWGYQQLAMQQGAVIHSASPVLDWRTENGKQLLVTPQGRVRAERVVIASNGYTPKALHPGVQARSLPVLSQIIVTQPLSAGQLAACNLLTSQVVMDTRALKYYYRKLPDNRILFGGRGAITGKGAEDPYFAKRLLAVLKQSFPALSDVQYDYSWSGWICMALDDIPHLAAADDCSKVLYSMGYCGAGLTFSAQAGKRLAQRIAGVQLPAIPLYQQRLPRFPLPALRRLGQWGYFQYGRVKDQWF
ncbi:MULTISPECIES: NAD(P)/FAD-dependent oxidoreductase [Rheinheimera]|uniref:NAD(P)/FAD-dependent oxidoreductase n=1 Tax=Rheinheimera marina TaxID=1774958 RepID=A0ABV9JFL1_9GAMM